MDIFRYVVQDILAEHSMLVQLAVEVLVILLVVKLCLRRIRDCIREIREILRVWHGIGIDAVKHKQELARRKKGLRKEEGEVAIDELKEKDKMMSLLMGRVIGLAVIRAIGSMFVKSPKRGEGKLLSPPLQGGREEKEEGESSRA